MIPYRRVVMAGVDRRNDRRPFPVGRYRPGGGTVLPEAARTVECRRSREPTMSVDPKLLEILVCPITKVSVRMLGRQKLAVLNRAIAEGHVKHMHGAVVDTPLDEALVTSDGRTVYRVDDGIPIMLEDSAIPTEQLADW